ncbi:pectate lyase C [Paraglaciecola sp. 25GB23A]|uniref:pectate lyase family protein n=1 Tax=Paraglaciecola sp. 25GB23A TaxID=3156068 RepID=UPI0032AFD4B5
MKLLNKFTLLFCSVLIFSCGSVSFAQPTLAFPEAQGYGKYTVGGRGGQVIIVDSLEDSVKARPGTLRYALKAKGPRIVVFNVSGIIHLVKPLEIKEDFVTIAGQTSPQGIVITGSETQIDANQVIIRYLRFRPGSAHEQGDAVTAKRLSNIIIDHCSMSWANDEVASFYNNTDFTLQYSIISESLNNAGHKKGSHGYGGIWGGQRASFINNVLAHHTSRNPRINGYRLKPNYPATGELVDIRNNVIYNWSNNSTYGNEGGRVNLVNNTYKQGPAKSEARFFQINFPDGKTDLGQMYINGNTMTGDEHKSQNNQLAVEFKNEKNIALDEALALKIKILVSQPFEDNTSLISKGRSAAQSYAHLVIDKEVGANRVRQGYFQDSVDQRILTEIAQGSAAISNGIIDSELQVIRSWDDYALEFSSEDMTTAISQTSYSDVQQWIDELGKFN